VDKHLIAWQMMDAPKNTLFSQRLCEVQVLASVVIAMIHSKFGNHMQHKFQHLG
jgi:hypothetical protein